MMSQQTTRFAMHMACKALQDINDIIKGPGFFWTKLRRIKAICAIILPALMMYLGESYEP